MTNQEKLDTYYRVSDGCESPLIFETIEEALEYFKDCLDGIDYGFPVSIEKVKMTANQFNSLPEGL